MKNRKTLKMVQLAILTAIVLIFAFTPLGYLKTPAVEITFLKKANGFILLFVQMMSKLHMKQLSQQELLPFPLRESLNSILLQKN